MISRHVKLLPPSLTFGKCKSKPQWDIASQMLRKKETARLDEDTEKLELECTVGGNVNWCSHDPLSTGFSRPGYSSGPPLPPGGSSSLRDQTRSSCISCTGTWILYHWATWEVLRKTVWSFNKLKLLLQYDPAISTLDIYSKEVKSGSQRDICTIIHSNQNIETTHVSVSVWGD